MIEGPVRQWMNDSCRHASDGGAANVPGRGAKSEGIVVGVIRSRLWRTEAACERAQALSPAPRRTYSAIPVSHALGRCGPLISSSTGLGACL